MRTNGERNPAGKAFHAFKAMAEDPTKAWGVRELARKLSMTPSATYRVLTVLQEEGLVNDDPRCGGYHLGLEFFRIAWRASIDFPLRQIAIPIMQALVAACNETSLLGLYDSSKMQMQFAASVDSSHPLRYVVELHKWLPVYAGASGLAIMAFLPVEERRSIIVHTKLKPVTAETITSSAELDKVMTQIRQSGYAFTRGQRTYGAVGIAAPIWAPGNRVVGDLTITIPEQRFRLKSLGKLSMLVVQHANRISSRLAGSVKSTITLDAKSLGGRTV